nr:hypothetical protein [Gordonia phthalatica]
MDAASAAHRDVGGAVRLAGDDHEPRHRRAAQFVAESGTASDQVRLLRAGPDEEAGKVDEDQDRQPERVTDRDEVRRLLAGVGVEGAGVDARLIRDHAQGRPFTRNGAVTTFGAWVRLSSKTVSTSAIASMTSTTSYACRMDAGIMVSIASAPSPGRCGPGVTSGSPPADGGR